MPRKRQQAHRRTEPLPLVLWSVVFGYLPVCHVFVVCRLVCRALSKVHTRFREFTGTTKHLRKFARGSYARDAEGR